MGGFECSTHKLGEGKRLDLIASTHHDRFARQDYERLVEQGMSIIMISSELPEILGMSDRIYIVSSGRLSGELPIEEATQEKIMQLATN